MGVGSERRKALLGRQPTEGSELRGRRLSCGQSLWQGRHLALPRDDGDPLWRHPSNVGQEGAELFLRVRVASVGNGCRRGDKMDLLGMAAEGVQDSAQ